jgi:2-polyprenyl-6-methoxyphenol hydroxylase-like FAD-dependent oxidoreductase
MILALLLARRGVSVRLVEAHLDFDRDFRGDTVHPSTLEILDSLGLADRLLALPHSVVRRIALQTSEATFTVADFTRLKSKFPFVALIPQAKFLEFLASEARRLPAFHLTMGANVKELLREGSRTRGVRYQSHDGWGEVRAELTVACDGRFSRLRELAGAVPVKSSPPMDVLWFRLPRFEGDTDPAEAAFRIGPGKLLIRLDRGDQWQVGYVIAKGGYHHLRSRSRPRA